MEKLYFLFLLIFLQNNSQIKENPIILIEEKNPVVLSTNDDDYYYVMAERKYIKIHKDSGYLEGTMNSLINKSENYFYFTDNLYQNYLFLSEKYYVIIFDKWEPFIFLDEISVGSLQKNGPSNMIKVGGIVKNNDDDFIIYGYSDKGDCIIFARKSREKYVSIQIEQIDNIIEKLSCKFIEGEIFICAINIGSYLHLYYLKYHIDEGDSKDDSLSIYENSQYSGLNEISDFGLYNTDNNNIKLLCFNIDIFIQCTFFELKIMDEDNVVFENIGASLEFYSSNAFSENNCYFIPFNSEYLFCCAVSNYIKCYMIDPETKYVINQY